MYATPALDSSAFDFYFNYDKTFPAATSSNCTIQLGGNASIKTGNINVDVTSSFSVARIIVSGDTTGTFQVTKNLTFNSNQASQYFLFHGTGRTLEIGSWDTKGNTVDGTGNLIVNGQAMSLSEEPITAVPKH